MQDSVVKYFDEQNDKKTNYYHPQKLNNQTMDTYHLSHHVNIHVF